VLYYSQEVLNKRQPCRDNREKNRKNPVQTEQTWKRNKNALKKGKAQQHEKGACYYEKDKKNQTDRRFCSSRRDGSLHSDADVDDECECGSIREYNHLYEDDWWG
jgi:hypothetical protein